MANNQGQSPEDEQNEFVSWLADQLQVKTHEELQEKLKQMGADGIKQAYQKFQETKQQGDDSDKQGDDEGAPASMKNGGKLDFIKCLQAFKRGGAMEAKKCGCGDKMKKGGKAKMQDGGQAEDNTDTSQTMKHGGVSKKQDGGYLTTATDGSNSVYDSRKPLGPDNRLFVDKGNGKFGPWGNPLPQGQNANQNNSVGTALSFNLSNSLFGKAITPQTVQSPAAVKPQVIPSDKAVGYSSTYYPANGQQRGKAVETVHSNIFKKGGELEEKKEKKTNIQPTWNKRGGKAKDPSKMTAYDVPVSKAGSRMSKVDGEDKDMSGKKVSGTNIQPKWAKKATKGKTKPKSNDVKQAHNG